MEETSVFAVRRPRLLIFVDRYSQLFQQMWKILWITMKASGKTVDDFSWTLVDGFLDTPSTCGNAELFFPRGC